MPDLPVRHALLARHQVLLALADALLARTQLFLEEQQLTWNGTALESPFMKISVDIQRDNHGIFLIYLHTWKLFRPKFLPEAKNC